MNTLRDEIADIIGNACCEFMDRDGVVTLGPYADAVLALLREWAVKVPRERLSLVRDPFDPQPGFVWLLDLGEGC